MIEVIAIPALKDNYIWCLQNKDSHCAVIVDPGDAEPVLKHLQQEKLDLEAILITHHHGDHSAGAVDLAEHYPTKIYSSHLSNLPILTHKVKENEDILFPKTNLALKVLEIPGHTLDHIAFYNEKYLFCGDTLFACGCGRVFEGTYEQMVSSLAKLNALNPQTLVFCGHEYTVSNCQFAVAVDPHNQILQKFLLHTQTKRENNLCSLPTILAQEKDYNPFLRLSEKEILAQASRHSGKMLSSDTDVFTVLREWKNSFKG